MNAKENAFDVNAEHLVELFFGDASQRAVFADSSIGEQNVDVPFLLLHNRVKPVQVGEIRCVALDAGNVLANLFHRGVQFTLAAASNKNVSCFADEAVGRSKPNASAASGYDCNFAFEFLHGVLMPQPAGRCA